MRHSGGYLHDVGLPHEALCAVVYGRPTDLAGKNGFSVHEFSSHDKSRFSGYNEHQIR